MNANSPTLLDGIRVLDASRIIAGPLCARLLLDLGATVTKLERIGVGDEARTYLRGDVDGVGISPLFAGLNAGKRSIAVDLGTAAGKDLARRLAEQSDVFIHNFRPGVVERLGLDPATLQAANPGIVYASVSGFGEVGPLRTSGGNDIAAQAYSGLMSIMGEPGGRPIRSPVQVADYTAGYTAAVAVLGGLAARARPGHDGRGCVVTTSLLESMLELMGQHVVDYLVTGIPMVPLGSGNRLGQPNQAFETSDGYVVISSVNEAMWQRLATALGRPQWIDDPRFLTVVDRVANQTELVAAMEAVTRRRTKDELVAVLQEAGVACAPINRVDAIAEDPQVRSLDMLADVDYLGAGIRGFGSPFAVDGRRRRGGAVPALGQHTDAILTELGYDDGARAALHDAGVVARP